MQPEAQKLVDQLRTGHIFTSASEKLVKTLGQHLLTHTKGTGAHFMEIIGHSGTGKSVGLKRFLAKYKEKRTETSTHVPVLYVQVPSKASAKDLACEILRTLGDPFWNRGNLRTLNPRLVQLLKQTDTRLILLDEVNHLIDRGQTKSHEAVADWLKQIINLTEIPIVLCGTPSVRRFIDSTDQLRSRTANRITLKAFRLTDDHEDAHSQEWLAVLQKYEKAVQKQFDINISTGELPALLVYATDGRFRDLVKLLVSAVQLASEQSLDRISLELLQQAFRESIYPDALDVCNPFHEAFVRRRLDKPSEPFHEPHLRTRTGKSNA